MSIGDYYKGLVMGRTGIDSSELKCPHEKSSMTPCVARDGDTAMTKDEKCVGCGLDVKELIKIEKSKLKEME